MRWPDGNYLLNFQTKSISEKLEALFQVNLVRESSESQMANMIYFYILNSGYIYK